MRRLVILLLGAAAVASASLVGPEDPSPPSRLVVLSWDGAGDAEVDRLLGAGRLPHLAALAARGVAAEHSVASFPTKTAASHAALWTGCWGDRNGVTGNEVPAPGPGRTLLETLSGFSSEALTAEPLYLTAARVGRRVVVLAATQEHPAEPHRAALAAAGVEPERLEIVSQFRHRLAPGELLGAERLTPLDDTAAVAWGLPPESARGARELVTAVGETPIHVLLHDDPAVATVGLDTALVRVGGRGPDANAEARLRPRAASATAPVDPRRWWSSPLPVASGGRAGRVVFRLFRLAPDGSELALYRRAVQGIDGTLAPDLAAEYLAVYPLHDDPFRLYRDGGLGTPLPEGGDGRAERRTLEIVAHDLALAGDGVRWAIERLGAQVVFHYTPQSDSAAHTWTGLLDPRSAAHDPRLASRLRPFHDRVLELQDAWLGVVAEAAGEEATVAVVSDHGLAAIDRLFLVNRALEAAGLLAADDVGGIDLARTRALAPPGTSGFQVWVNGTDHAEGIVPPAERAAVVEAAEEALLSVVDPLSGRHVVRRVFRPEEAPGIGIGGPRGADLYLDTARGVYPRSDPPGLPEPRGPLLVPDRTGWGSGEHGFWPELRPMHAIFYAAGPGLARGVRLPPIRHIDVAPLLSRAVGLPPPPCSRGMAPATALVSRAGP